VNNNLNNDQAQRFVTLVSQHNYLQDHRLLKDIASGSLLGYFIKELYDYMKRVVKIDMRCLHEYRNLNEELKYFQKLK
jgi:hypothetical protein